jgi:glutamine synthetase
VIPLVFPGLFTFLFYVFTFRRYNDDVQAELTMTQTPHYDDIRPLVRRIGKLPGEWQRSDLLQVCVEDDIRVLVLHYPAIDGKLKELRVPVNNRAYLERVLAAGERVDGSSLFPGLFSSGQSDLYVVPVYKWAFRDPWMEDVLHIVCRFAGKDGLPAAITPDNLLAATVAKMRAATNLDLHGLAELEYYLILDRDDERFTGRFQRSYHQSAPYQHGWAIADEILRVISEITGGVKYSHSEVGYLDRLSSENPELNGKRFEQYEVEFDLMPVEDLGCWLTVARWLIRVIADLHGASVTFLPKVEEGLAGSGMHLHLALMNGERNIMGGDGPAGLSDEALKLVGGVLKHSQALTAFGNAVAGSYLRLVPEQEAPTKVCWGAHNRSSLVRVPLSFAASNRMDQQFNPNESGVYPASLARPTVELRSPDGSAFTDLLLAAVSISVLDGLSADWSIDYAKQLFVEGNIFKLPEVAAKLEDLPSCCVDSAQLLREMRGFFEGYGFAPRIIDIVIDKLMDEADKGLVQSLMTLPPSERMKQVHMLMHKDVHKH